jgi:hypothetical protein
MSFGQCRIEIDRPLCSSLCRRLPLGRPVGSRVVLRGVDPRQPAPCGPDESQQLVLADEAAVALESARSVSKAFGVSATGAPL